MEKQLLYNLKENKLGKINIHSLDLIADKRKSLNGYVFMDNSSFIYIKKNIERVFDSNSFNYQFKKSELLGKSTLDFLQSIVIYEGIITDGFVLANNHDSYAVVEIFADFISGFWISDKLRDNIVNSVKAEAKKLENKLTSENENDANTAYSDKYLFDRLIFNFASF